MSIYCTLKRAGATAQQTEYRVINAGLGFAQVEKRNPVWCEEYHAFDVPVIEIASLILVDDETMDTQVLAQEGITVEDAFRIENISKQASARAWFETKDIEVM